MRRTLENALGFLGLFLLAALLATLFLLPEGSLGLESGGTQRAEDATLGVLRE